MTIIHTDKPYFSTSGATAEDVIAGKRKMAAVKAAATRKANREARMAETGDVTPPEQARQARIERLPHLDAVRVAAIAHHVAIVERAMGQGTIEASKRAGWALDDAVDAALAGGFDPTTIATLMGAL